MTDQPLIKIISPDRWAGVGMNFIDAGYVGLLVKNGQIVRKLEPGRHFSFAIPWIEQSQIVLVDTKVRNLEVVSEGDFFSQDQYVVNVSLSVMYQVIDPKRIAIELSDAIAALESAIKDTLGVIINQMSLIQLTQTGRVQAREYLLSHIDSIYLLGFNLEDVRISDISFPQKPGIVRQIEGLTARAEAAAQTPPPPSTVVLQQQPAVQPVAPQPPHPALPTVIAPTEGMARLVHRGSGEAIALRSRNGVALSASRFTIGREDHHDLVVTDPLCSRNHAHIEQVSTEGAIEFQLVDVGSSNGTFLNGQRLIANQPAPLRSNDVIKIGSEEWTFE